MQRVFRAARQCGRENSAAGTPSITRWSIESVRWHRLTKTEPALEATGRSPPGPTANMLALRRRDDRRELIHTMLPKFVNDVAPPVICRPRLAGTNSLVSLIRLTHQVYQLKNGRPADDRHHQAIAHLDDQFLHRSACTW